MSRWAAGRWACSKPEANGVCVKVCAWRRFTHLEGWLARDRPMFVQARPRGQLARVSFSRFTSH